MTVRLYYTDSYQQEFKATVVDKQQKGQRIALQLDQTCFYPTSGGQPHDFGHIEKIPVVDAREESGQVLHILEQDRFEVGQTVSASIDWERRFDHMQQHTGQHILSQAFVQCLNCQTLSTHLGNQISSIDLSRQQLDTDDIYRVENLANTIIFKNHPIKLFFADNEEAKRLGLRKASQRSGSIRIIDITGFDLSACGGTHCQRTGEVGIIKIRRWERVNRQVRVQFYCGYRALKDYRWKNRTIHRLSRLYSASEQELVQTGQEHLENIQELRKQFTHMKDSLLRAESSDLVKGMKLIKGVEVICEILLDTQRDRGRDLAQRIVEHPRRVALLGISGEKPTLFFACSDDLSYNMTEWIRICAVSIDGRGGGRRTQAQAGGTRKDGLQKALHTALEQL